MTVFLGIIAFAFALYLFLITNNKIKALKNNLLLEDTKKELEALITEFNRAAARNIELLEDKITTLEDLIKKADIKILKLDEATKSNIKPIIIERIVEKKENETKIEKESVKKEPVENKEKKLEKPEEEKNQRIEELKQLLESGKTKEEIISMGFMENEINLVSFLVKTKRNKV